jgi:uncharacterized protein (DUF4415 family)
MTFQRTHGTASARRAAEALFKPAAMDGKPRPEVLILDAKELVSLRLDRDMLELFRKEGFDWRERINATLRKAAGL